MNLFRKKEKKSKWEPLICHIQDILSVMQECIDINAPLAEFTFQYEDVLHTIGISSDYSNKQGFFDIEYYLDDQTFSSYDELLTYGELALKPLFINNDAIAVLEEKYVGDPRNYKRLSRYENGNV